MPLYELLCIARMGAAQAATAKGNATAAAELIGGSQFAIAAQVARTASLHVLDRGGVVRNIRAIKADQLPYRMKRHQEIFTNGSYYCMQFDSSPETMDSLRRALHFDERVIRSTIIKLGDSLKDVSNSVSLKQ
ncbi:hypothetical protein HDU76_011069 [Blyttiomyces sp. JEL0837]|nr:hypothetical protein HDU76_011069 [Blyttiomyces sp. JEL0837]